MIPAIIPIPITNSLPLVSRILSVFAIWFFLTLAARNMQFMARHGLIG